jgi:hypothetical protein
LEKKMKRNNYVVKNNKSARRQWLMPVILATRKAKIRRITVWSQPGKIVPRPYFEKRFTKIGLVEWLKVKTLSSSPRTTKKKKNLSLNICLTPSGN